MPFYGGLTLGGGAGATTPPGYDQMLQTLLRQFPGLNQMQAGAGAPQTTGSVGYGSPGVNLYSGQPQSGGGLYGSTGTGIFEGASAGQPESVTGGLAAGYLGKSPSQAPLSNTGQPGTGGEAPSAVQPAPVGGAGSFSSLTDTNALGGLPPSSQDLLGFPNQQYEQFGPMAAVIGAGAQPMGNQGAPRPPAGFGMTSGASPDFAAMFSGGTPQGEAALGQDVLGLGAGAPLEALQNGGGAMGGGSWLDALNSRQFQGGLSGLQGLFQVAQGLQGGNGLGALVGAGQAANAFSGMAGGPTIQSFLQSHFPPSTPLADLQRAGVSPADLQALGATGGEISGTAGMTLGDLLPYLGALAGPAMTALQGGNVAQSAAQAGVGLGTALGYGATGAASLSTLPITAGIGAMVMPVINDLMGWDQGQNAIPAKLRETADIQRNLAAAWPQLASAAPMALQWQGLGALPPDQQIERLREIQRQTLVAQGAIPAVSQYISTRGGAHSGIGGGVGGSDWGGVPGADVSGLTAYTPELYLQATLAQLAANDELARRGQAVTPEGYSANADRILGMLAQGGGLGEPGAMAFRADPYAQMDPADRAWREASWLQSNYGEGGTPSPGLNAFGEAYGQVTPAGFTYDTEGNASGEAFPRYHLTPEETRALLTPGSQLRTAGDLFRRFNPQVDASPLGQYLRLYGAPQEVRRPGTPTLVPGGPAIR